MLIGVLSCCKSSSFLNAILLHNCYNEVILHIKIGKINRNDKSYIEKSL